MSARPQTPHTQADGASPGHPRAAPQRAKPAHKSVRCGVGDGTPRPHPPHPQPVGSGPRPHAPSTGGGVRESAQPQTPYTQQETPPPWAPSCRPHSGQSQLARARAVGLETGSHTHTPCTHSQWVAGPGRTPEGRAVGRGRAPNPGPPTPRREAPPPRAPSCRPHSAHSQLTKAGMPAGGRATPSKARGRRDRATPPRAKEAEHGTGAGNAEGREPPGTALPAPCTGNALGARARPTRRGGGCVRGSTSAQTRNGYMVRTRRATGPSPQNAQTAWNGVPAGKGKGHPGGTGRNTHCEGHEGTEEPKGRSKNRQRPRPPRPAASAAHTRRGHCTRHGSSSTQCWSPAPRLGSLRASPWGSHWRQASSTEPAAPAARVTTHQGGGVVGKRLQPRLLSDALTGEWRNGEPGEGQGSKPREPGGLRHQAGAVSCRAPH